MNTSNKTIQANYLLPFILVTSMFFMWGLANNMTDTLLSAFKRIMSMTDFQTSWIQVAFYGSYFCLAIPAALLIRKYEYKTGILVGLGLFIAGALLFYPASQTMSYAHFLIALFVLAGGLSILETTANPYVLSMGSESTAVRRLNLAQSFNPIGSLTGVVLSQVFILSQLNQATEADRAQLSTEALQSMQQDELSAVMGPYVGVALVLLLIWLIIYFKKMPTGRESTNSISTSQSIKALLQNKNYLWGVFAQFVYVGAQIGVWSFIIRYVMAELSVNESTAANWYIASLVAFTIARFGFTALMKWISSAQLLLISAIGAVLCTALSIYSSGMVGVICLVGISACMSLMFPTIFGLASATVTGNKKLAGSGLIMAILGGAVLTPIQGIISDNTGSIHMAYYVPLICFCIVAVYAWTQTKLVKS